MRKMFTRLFGLALLLVLFSTTGRSQVQQPTDCGQILDDSNVELVSTLSSVCDSSNVTFKVVGDFADTVYYAINHDGNLSGGFTDNPTFTVQKEGIDVLIQVMEVVAGDTCISEPHTFSTNAVDSIEIMEPTTEHPMCGAELGEVTILFDGGYDSEYLAAEGIEYPYLYSFVPASAWEGPGYYPAYTDVSPNLATGADTFYVTVFENKDTADLCLVDIMDIAAWDTAVVNETSPAVVVDSIYADTIDCFGGTASVFVEVSGGTGDSLLVQLWDADAMVVVDADTAIAGMVEFMAVAEGSYIASVVDSLGCEDLSDSTVVLVAPDEVKFDIAIQSVDCFGGDNGEIAVVLDTNFVGYDANNVYQALVVSLDTATDDFEQSWTTFVNDTATFTGLYAIYYSAFVRDSTNGCDSVPYENPNNSQNYISLQSPGEISLDLTYNDSIVCYGDSTDIIINNIIGGSGDFSVELVLGYSGSVIEPIADSVWRVDGGTYTIKVVDNSAASCPYDSTIVIHENSHVNFNVETSDPLCAAQDDGLITITEAWGGTGYYEYAIADTTGLGELSELYTSEEEALEEAFDWKPYNVFNASAGVYVVLVRDSVCNLNVDMELVEIYETPNVLELDHDTDTLICNGSDSAYVEFNLESWSGVGPHNSGLVERNIRAYYTSDESSVYDAAASTEMDRYVWGEDFATYLSAGTYYIWAVDTMGCELDTNADGNRDYLTLVIDEFDELQLFVDVVDSASCAGINDGTIKLTMLGGDTTSWFFAGMPPFAVAEKSASVQSYDGPEESFDCTFGSFKYAVAKTYQQALLKDPEDMNCWPLVNLGIKSANVEEEKSATAAPGDYYAKEVYINVTAGTHYIVLYDETCGDRTIEEVTVFGHGAVTIGDVDSVTNIVCYGDKAGEIFVDPAMGGSGDLLYTLYEGGKTMADTVAGYVEVTDTAFVGLPAGDYYVGVKDFGPSACAGDFTDMISVTQPDLDFSIEVFDISCNGAADGLVVLSMEGAEGGAPMFRLGTSNWRPFDNYSEGVWTKNVNVVEPREYTVYAIDTAGYLAGCDGMGIDFEIVEPPVLEVTAVGVDTTDCSIADDGYITVSIEGGKTIVDSFEVQLTGIDTALIARDSVLVFEGLENGTYEIIVTEVDSLVNNPCIYTDSIDVLDNGIIASIDEFTEMLACKGDSTGKIVLDITGGSEVYLVTITDTASMVTDTVVLDSNNAITGLPAGDYEVFIQDSVEMAGNDTVCTVTLPVVKIDEPLEYLMLDVTKIQDVTCQDSGMFSLQASGGTGTYMYYAALSEFPEHILLPDPNGGEWQSDSIFKVADAGTWVVWVMDEAGCIVGGEFDRDGVTEVNKWRVPILPANVQVTFEATVVDPVLCSGDLATVIVHPDSVTIEVDGVEESRGYTVWFENLAGEELVVNDTVMAMDTVIAWVQDTLSGCKGFDTVAISQPEELMAVSLTKGDGEFTCPDVVEGYIEAYATGGTAPYTYQLWQNGEVKTPYREDYSFLVDVDNSYTFVVMDDNGCTDTLDVAVDIESADPILFDLMDVTCSGDTAASVEVSIEGMADRLFKVKYEQYEIESDPHVGETEWYPAGEVIPLDQVFRFDNENEDDQHYAIWVVDSIPGVMNGCTSEIDSVTFDQLITDDLTQTVVVGDVNGCGTDVTITGTGGVAPYTILINDEVVTESVVTLGGGEHIIKVVDAHGCSPEILDTLDLAYPMSMDTLVTMYVGDTVDFVYGTIAEELTAEEEGVVEYTFYNMVDTACTEEVVVTVDASVRTAPAIDTVTPTDTIETNHAVFTMVFEDVVSFNNEVMGYLTVTQKDSAEFTIEIPITEDMVDGNTITVDYDYEVVGMLDLNTTYTVSVDSGIVTGDGLPWDGNTGVWEFTTGADYPTGINPGVETVEFSVYPNPFNDFIRIDNADKLDRVIVSNIAGQRILDIEYPSYEIRTGNLVTGVYVVTLIANDEIVKSERIIKR
ncbi:T9SS type A sorting domain-containing protein [uncultured Draconibacterium sp.]|uniref:T9SS type A sorting domain-containing protein n=1 Tax=uncultured Draconibacterium sp. TaxID=1573823 RepID=UPI002AA708CE|nr:T9SS type A sorting domain-containing protein [uncultured Draconibacterium sp.]